MISNPVFLYQSPLVIMNNESKDFALEYRASSVETTVKNLCEAVNHKIAYKSGTTDVLTDSATVFRQQSITRGFPGFDLDMNRIFPGSEQSLSDSAAAAIIEDIKTADFAIDIHASNIFLRELPQARVNVNSANSLVKYAEMHLIL